MSIPKIEKAIGDLKSRIGDRRRELREWETQLEQLQSARVKLVYGAGVGDVVVSKGKEYRVTHFSALWADKPWAHGNPRNKDGKFGAADRALYGEWEPAS